jgi:hypothetical protein
MIEGVDRAQGLICQGGGLGAEMSRHDLILVQVAQRDGREGRAASGKGRATGFCISAGRFRRALPSVDGAASTVAPDSGQPAGAMRGGVLVSQSRREAGAWSTGNGLAATSSTCWRNRRMNSSAVAVMARERPLSTAQSRRANGTVRE